MKIITCSILLMLLFSCNSHTGDSRLIFYNGTIYTVNDSAPQAEAVVVESGKIAFVGALKDAMKWKDRHTTLMDLDGKMMMPGFIEGHAHFMGEGYGKLELDLNSVSSYEELVSKVAERVATMKPGVWITGRGWHQDKWDSISSPVIQGFPTHDMLSAVSPDNPVFLKHASGHAALANAEAMKLAGVNADTPDVDGGEIFKDQEGKPTGIFNETAQGLISRVIPENDESNDQLAFEKAIESCLSNGITSFHDAGVSQDVIDLYKRNLEKGSLTVRLYAMLSGSDKELISHYFSTGPEIGLGNDFLTIRSIKLYGDGALGSRGAWLLEEYEDMHGAFGHSTMPVPDILEISRKGIEHGFQICTHAIGDRANHEVLNQYQQAFSEYEKEPSAYRFRIEHAQHLHPEDIPRFGEMGVLPAMQAIHMSSDRPWAIDRLGKRRIEEGAYVWQELLKSGARIINGTDAPVEPIDPLACFYASVTRKTLKGQPPGGFEPKQKMTRDQALKSYTLDAAYGAFEEDIKGSIEVGKYADFVLLSQDIMTIGEEEILNTKVVMTIVNGEIVYSDGTLKANH